MKQLTIILTICVSALTNCLQAVEKTIQPTLKHATIYFQGAELTYNDNVQLVKGENEIRLTGLSPDLDKNSIRLTTSKSVAVNAYEYKMDYLTGSAETKFIKQWNDSLLSCNTKILELNDNITNRENILQLLAVNPSKDKEGEIDFEVLMKYADYYQKKGTELMTELRTFKKQKEDLSLIASRLQNQISQENNKKTKQGVLVVKLNALANVTSDLKLVYYTNGASWSPSYDVIAKKINEPLLFKYKANVQQTTGIDWSNVTLRLTTTMPTFGKTAPLLRTWFVDFYKPVYNLRASRSMASSNVMVQNSYSYDSVNLDELDAPMKEVSISDYITQGENDISQTFDISLPYSITGNGREQYIDLIEKSVPAEFSYYTVPKMGEEAYLLAEISNWESLGLLSGNANITFGDTFMGTTFIDSKSTLSKLPLTLGVDERISVKREKTEDFSAKKTFGSNIIQTFSYKITVKNNQNQSIKLIVKDQYPISSNKEIKVEELKQTTTPTTTNKEVGVLVWELDLPSGASKEFINAFSVQYPKDKPINF